MSKRGISVISNFSFICLLGIIILFIISCASQLPPPPEMNFTLPSFEKNDSVRPVFNRTLPPEENISGEEANITKNDSLIFKRLEAELLMPIPINKNIGEISQYKIITFYEFPLLKGIPLQRTRPPYPHTASYIQELRFDFGKNSTGKVISAAREEEEVVKDFLFFEEGKPIFEYRLLLSEGTFRDYLESPIRILGVDYVIAEAEEGLVVFFGKDIGQYIRFQNNSKIKIGRDIIPDTNVEIINNREIRYRVYAGDEDDIGLLVGINESLSSRMRHPKALLSPIFDIYFRGLQKGEMPLLNYTEERIIFKHSDNKYDLIFRSRLDKENRIPLLYLSNGEIEVGEEGERLHIQECRNTKDFCIEEGERVILNFQDASVVMRYSGINNNSQLITFTDELGSKFVYDFKGIPGKNASAEIFYNGRRFKVYIGYNNSTDNFPISMDLDGNYGINGALMKIYTMGEEKIEFKPSQNYWNITISIPRKKMFDYKDEKIIVQIFINGSELKGRVFGVFEYDEDEKDAFLRTPFGAWIRVTEPEIFSNYADGEDINITMPLLEVIALISLKGEPATESVIS